MITPAQIRAARAILQWRQADLAREAGVSDITIKNIERGVSDPRASTLGAIEGAFEKAGVTFVQDIATGSTGVMFRTPTKRE